MKMNKYLKYYLLFGLIYFGQGIDGLPSQSISYWLKETLFLTVRQVSFLGIAGSICWTIKPIWGFISDVYPIFGKRRKGYMLIAYTCIVCLSLFIFIFGLNLYTFILVSFLSSLAFAFADVCIDGSMVELGQKHKITGKIQAIQWGCISFAAVIVGLSGGYIAEYLNYQYAALIVGFIILVILGIIYWKYEDTVSFVKKSDRIKQIKQLAKHKSLWFAGLFLFCLWFSPSFGVALFYKMRDVLMFDKIFIGMLASLTSLSAIVGALVYFKICKKIRMKSLLYLSATLSALSAFVYLYFPNGQVAIIYACIFGGVNMLCHLSIMDFCAIITPKGTEAVTFAGLCSLLNLGALGGSLVGGFLYPILGLNWLIIISGIFTFCCLLFIPYLNIKEQEKED